MEVEAVTAVAVVVAVVVVVAAVVVVGASYLAMIDAGDVEAVATPPLETEAVVSPEPEPVAATAAVPVVFTNSRRFMRSPFV